MFNQDFEKDDDEEVMDTETFKSLYQNPRAST